MELEFHLEKDVSLKRRMDEGATVDCQATHELLNTTSLGELTFELQDWPETNDTNGRFESNQ